MNSVKDISRIATPADGVRAGGTGRRSRFPAIALLASLSLTVAGCAQLPGSPGQPSCQGGPDVACTAQGAVRGIVENGTVAFKNIPYAAPPVGALRFRPPAPPAAWQGVRDGSRFGAICPQLSGNEVIGAEDCLTLNIWRPATAAAAPLPVMVFLTGGGNHGFSGQGAPVFGGVNYNGGKLVPEGVVYVSFNARLGALGYLAHPALDAERAEKVSGNYGSLDHIAMLAWLRRNIAAFGGDPQRVFLFGTSAGGGNICALMTAPAARGLFHGAAMHSSVPTGCELQTLAEAEQGTGRQVARAAGCESGADVAACLRGKSAAELVKAVPGTFGVSPRLYGPNVDGAVFPEQPLAAIARRAHAPMPVIVGDSANETVQFVNSVGPIPDAAAYAAAVATVFGATDAPRIMNAYPVQGFPTPRDAFVRLTTDALFTCQSRRVARTLSQAQSQPVFRFQFNHALENDPQQKALGAVHTVEHMFFFPWQGNYVPTETDQAIQQRMVTYWTGMARNGRPGNAGNVEWLPYTPQNDAYLDIGAVTAMKSGPREAQCAFWDTLRLPWPHV